MLPVLLFFDPGGEIPHVTGEIKHFGGRMDPDEEGFINPTPQIVHERLDIPALQGRVNTQGHASQFFLLFNQVDVDPLARQGQGARSYRITPPPIISAQRETGYEI